MNRQEYMKLRFDVKQELGAVLRSSKNVDVLTNNVMRLFLESIATDEIKRQVAMRQLNEFKRDPNIKAPSWAYRDPGLSDRNPTMKEAEK